MESAFLIVMAVVLVLLLPLVPKMQEFRIRSLRFVRLKAAADWHQRHFAGTVLFARISMVVVAVVLFALGLRRM